MKQAKIFKTLLIFTTVVILLAVGISLTIIWKNARDKEREGVGENYLAFGELTSPTDRNIKTSLTLNFTSEISNVLTIDKIYEIDTSSEFFPSKNLADNLSNLLNYDFTGEQDNISIYSDEQGDTLMYFDEFKKINISYSTQSTKVGTTSDKEALSEIAASKLKELSLWPWKDDSSYMIKYRYYTLIGYNIYEVDSEGAPIIGIVFSSIYENGFNSFSTRINSGEIEVTIDSNNSIYEINYMYRPIDAQSFATYPIKTFSEAVTSIEQRNAEIILPFDSVPSSSVTIDSSLFSYLIEDSDQKYLQPVYVFEGIDNYNQKVTLITPAVENEYLTINFGNQ